MQAPPCSLQTKAPTDCHPQPGALTPATLPPDPKTPCKSSRAKGRRGNLLAFTFPASRNFAEPKPSEAACLGSSVAPAVTVPLRLRVGAWHAGTRHGEVPVLPNVALSPTPAPRAPGGPGGTQRGSDSGGKGQGQRGSVSAAGMSRVTLPEAEGQCQRYGSGGPAQSTPQARRGMPSRPARGLQRTRGGGAEGGAELLSRAETGDGGL